MGVVYSVVLEVVPQFGLQQIVTKTNWSDLLGAAGTTEDLLREGDTSANQAVLNAILDGSLNGTGLGSGREPPPPAPTDPDITVSRYPALLTRRSVNTHEPTSIGRTVQAVDRSAWSTTAGTVGRFAAAGTSSQPNVSGRN